MYYTFSAINLGDDLIRNSTMLKAHRKEKGQQQNDFTAPNYSKPRVFVRVLYVTRFHIVVKNVRRLTKNHYASSASRQMDLFRLY